jgi:hypothetical protein
MAEYSTQEKNAAEDNRQRNRNEAGIGDGTEACGTQAGNGHSKLPLHGLSRRADYGDENVLGANAEPVDCSWRRNDQSGSFDDGSRPESSRKRAFPADGV